MSYEAMSIIVVVVVGTLIGRFVMSGIIERSISSLIKSISSLIKSISSRLLNIVDTKCDTYYKSFKRQL